MSETTETTTPAPLGPSRRTLLKGAAVGAGALWVAPAVLTFAADPAAASPAGCELCGTTIPFPGNGIDTTGWSTTGSIWTSVGGVYEAGAVNSQRYRRNFTYNFSAACVARFNQPLTAQPQAQLTLSARLRSADTGGNNTAVFRVDFFPNANLGGGSAANTELSSASTILTPYTGSPVNIPIGTESIRIRLDLRGDTDVARRGQGDDLAITITTC